MNAFDKLTACTGTWRGTSTLQDPHSGTPLDSPSTLTITPILLGRFLRVAYTWDYHGEPQEGEFIIGMQNESGDLTSHWIDTWHMSDKGMTCTGKAGEDELLLPGSYPAPPGPDWGWNTVIRPTENELKVTMFNVPPGGREELAVEASYSTAEG
jgi:hypothetical protein